MKRRTITPVLVVIAVMMFMQYATASTFLCNDKECSKAEAVRLAVNNPKAKIIKIDVMEFSEKSGGLKQKVTKK